MASIRRIPVTWTTGPGGLGLSVFYSQDAADATADLFNFFNAIKGGFPTAVSWSIPSAGDKIDPLTGILNGSWSGGSAATLVATGATSLYAAGTGGFIRWNTDVIENGRRLKGRTFLVPLLADQYDAQGTINNAVITSWQTAANTLVATDKLVIWHRPTGGAANGSSADISSAVAPDKVTSLRTRRT